MPDPVSAGIQVAAGLAQSISGIVNAAKTKKIAKQLEASRPDYEISELAGQDLALAESEAATGGLSSRAETAYNNLNNQQFSSSLGAILRGGGSVNNVADVYGGNQEGRTRLALLNDQMRLQKINNLMKTRDMYRGEQDKAFQINEYAPWRDKTEANDKARTRAQEQIWNGVGQIGSAGMNFFGGKYNEGQYDKYFGGGGGGQQNQMPNGQQMWMDYKSQMERDNAPQGNYQLPQKYSTQRRINMSPQNLFQQDDLNWGSNYQFGY